jgi:acyl dehydratase
MSSNNGLAFEKIKQGDWLPEMRVKMDRDTYFAYNRLVKEINPLHFDREYAKTLGYRDIVVAGVYTFSFITRMIEDWLGDSGWISSTRVRFKNPAYIDETIVQTARVIRKFKKDKARHVECEILVKDMDGKELTSALVDVELLSLI